MIDINNIMTRNVGMVDAAMFVQVKLLKFGFSPNLTQTLSLVA
jgi:hypothetical protein